MNKQKRIQLHVKLMGFNQFTLSQFDPPPVGYRRKKVLHITMRVVKGD